MKIVRWLLVFACLAGYFFWPYHATRNFAAALEKKDAEAIKSMVDFDALRESILEGSVEAALSQAEARLPKGANFDREAMRDKVRAMLTSGPMKRHMEQNLSPDTIARVLTTHAPSEGGQGSGWRNEKWVSPVAFSVQDRNSESRVIFKFKGLGWKLCGLEIPRNEMDRMIAAVPR